MEQPIRKRRRRTKKSLNAKQLMVLAGCVIGAVALIVAACFIFGGNGKQEDTWEPKPQRTSMPELVVGQITRRDSVMVVDNSYLYLAYPYAHSEHISVVAVNQGNATALEFRARTSTMDEVLYTIWFNGTQEHWKHDLDSISNTDQVGAFDPGDGMGAVPVTVLFYKASADLSENDRGTFLAAQETFNNVLQSMHENEKFS